MTNEGWESRDGGSCQGKWAMDILGQLELTPVELSMTTQSPGVC